MHKDGFPRKADYLSQMCPGKGHVNVGDTTHTGHLARWSLCKTAKLAGLWDLLHNLSLMLPMFNDSNIHLMILIFSPDLLLYKEQAQIDFLSFFSLINGLALDYHPMHKF